MQRVAESLGDVGLINRGSRGVEKLTFAAYRARGQSHNVHTSVYCWRNRRIAVFYSSRKAG